MTRMRNAILASLLSLCAGPAIADPATPLSKIRRDRLCVTEGTIADLADGRMAIFDPKVRAVLTAITPPVAEARFTYLGPSEKAAPLASGQMRRQFGLKLRAQDGCNLIYVMWRIEPKAELVVSIKHNPGQRIHAECGTRGYRNLAARSATPVPVIRPGDAHTLRAQLQGDELTVMADGRQVWTGSVGPEASFDGPIGLRTDNGRFQVELLGGPLASLSRPPAPCTSSTGPE